MRSWPSLALAAGLFAVGLFAACGSDTGGEPRTGACDASYVDYTSFGEPFLLDWCSGCHSAALPATMRQMAPAGVDFDTLENVRRQKERIAARATGGTPTMPPAGGPSAEEREMLAEWISCGTK